MSTITKEFTKEQLQQIIETDHVQCGEASALARIALASLEAEPVAWLLSGGGAKNNVSFDSGNAYADPLREVTPLYTAPPAPISVPAAMEMDDDFDSSFEHGKAVGWNAYRAAMLQGAKPVTTAYKLPANTPCKDAPEHIWLQTAGIWPASRTEMGDVLLYRSATPAPVSVPDGYRLQPISEYDAMCAAMLQGANGTLTNEGTITATQFKPVADLYGLTSPTGGETSFTFDAVEARDFIDGGWSCQEYVELERFQEAVSGNSPVIPDVWVLVPEEPTHEMLEAGDEQFGTYDVYRRMIAASPQQEVK